MITLQKRNPLFKNIISAINYVKQNPKHLTEVVLLDKDFNIYCWNLNGKDLKKLKTLLQIEIVEEITF